MNPTEQRPSIRDAGLQAERTALAWARTALALAGVGILVARLLVVRIGGWAAAIEVVGGVVAGVSMLRAFNRYHRWSIDGARPHRAGGPNAALAGAVTILGLAAAVVSTSSLTNHILR